MKILEDWLLPEKNPHKNAMSGFVSDEAYALGREHAQNTYSWLDVILWYSLIGRPLVFLVMKTRAYSFARGVDEGKIKVGKYELSKGMVENRVWISIDSGEGGDFDLRELVDKHYKEYL